MATKIQQFLRRNPVFTYHTFATAISEDGQRTPNTIKALLAHHIQHGHIVRVRRQLFASIPVGADPETYPINPYLIAGYATNDAILAYDTALSFYNTAYSARYRFLYLTQYQTSLFHFREEDYQGIKFSPTLLRQKQSHCFVNTEDVQGLNIRVTSLERTLVDVLDKPLLGGGWEEIWHSLAMFERVNIKEVIDYALRLNKATTIAKVGFYLSQCQKELGVSQELLDRLRVHCPISPHYIDSLAKQEGKFIPEWNIIVPQSLVTKDWEEK
jgi:predicted transcriptional regulator of viral defense system